ncbi:MAG: twin-arginine translocase TatA/TatE family subunit [Anaerolineales bacterium]|nr:twin-arginine translocase TatA/TatE family subunit [Anaerolineales bacterium]
MDILGIGMPEFVFIVIIALIVLGPKDMQKAGKTIGTFLRKVVMSPEWRTVKDVSRKVSNLPSQWMREANEDLPKFRDEADLSTAYRADLLGTWSGAALAAPKPSAAPIDEESDSAISTENTIAPSATTPPENTDDTDA